MNNVQDIPPIGSKVNSDQDLDPDLRVNYETGLVLSVNEFRQEQLYFLEKIYLYNRALHGFGTVYGLNVTVQSAGDTSQDWTVTVTPGIAIDQWGRSIILRETLCAHLQAWLAKQDHDNQNSVITNLHTDDNGQTYVGQIYVVTSYQSYTTTFVPVLTLGCNGGITQAPSRIQDSYTIEFTWKNPTLPAWEGERNFAHMLSQIQIVPGGTTSDEQNIIQYISTQLDQPPPFFQLPALGARDALDRIMTSWITEICPTLNPNLLQKDSSAVANATLLTTINLQLQKRTDATTTTTPWLVKSATPDNTGRPVLLNTHLVQETIVQGQAPVAATGSSAITHPFVTVTVLNVSPLSFELWFHLNPDQSQNAVLTSCSVTVEQGSTNDNTKTVDCKVINGTEQNVFQLTQLTANAGNPPSNAGNLPLPAYLRLTFPVNQLLVQVPSDNPPVISLHEYFLRQNISYEGYNGKDAIITYVRVPQAAFV
jgi:hypothetical protein